MKKLVVILLFFCYGLSSSGMTITLHYCCGKLDDVSFLAKARNERCGKGSHLKKTSCCKDQQITGQIASHSPADKWLSVVKSFVQIPLAERPRVDLIQYFESTQTLARDLPDRHPGIPLFIKNCVFRV